MTLHLLSLPGTHVLITELRRDPLVDLPWAQKPGFDNTEVLPHGIHSKIECCFSNYTAVQSTHELYIANTQKRMFVCSVTFSRRNKRQHSITTRLQKTLCEVCIRRMTRLVLTSRWEAIHCLALRTVSRAPSAPPNVPYFGCSVGHHYTVSLLVMLDLP